MAIAIASSVSRYAMIESTGPNISSRAMVISFFTWLKTVGRTNQPLTRFGIHRLVTQYATMASEAVPTLATKRVSPHTIRHTTAVHLLRAGVDINTIRAWLGHVSLTTTNIYAEVDLEMKAKALANCEVEGEQSSKPWKEDVGLMEFLRTL